MNRPPIAPPHSPWRHQLQQLRARLSATAPQAEHSIPLRILIQLLVSVGIASVAIAAAGVAPASLLNLLAIPTSGIGAYWSWRSRQRSNVAVKFVIALGMLMALGIFLTRLVGDSGDTRIRLAELLIHLQVLHSFDMPRRKDLGYSVVIGLILVGVAATVSQTLTLAPVLMVFLAIVIPVLTLDYQSRLGLVLNRRRGMLAGIRVRHVMGLLLLVTSLGLAVFAALPRLPGYQIRNFPVSDTINFQGNFAGDQIINPGYTSGDEIPPETDDAGGDSTIIQGQSPVDGPGQMSRSTYYGFNQRINQNLRGSVTPQVMLRVRSQAPGFWRMLAFDHYTGQGWETSREDTVEVLERSSFSYQTYLPSAAFKTSNPASRRRHRQVIQTYTIVNPLPNLIPALYQASELYFPTRQVAIDAEGSLRSPLPLSPGLTFTTISRVPYRDRSALRTAGTTYSAETKTAYLQVPEAIQERVRHQTQALLAQSPQPLTSVYEQTLFLTQTLKQTYTLQPDLPFFDDDDDLVEAFLFTHEGGYGDHFSTVLTVMLRSIGIPARLVTGFAPGQFNPFTGYYIVNNTDAHAITEVYFPDYGWFAFDPIPGHDIIPPSIRDSQTFGVIRQFWNWIAGWLPSPVSGWISGLLTLLSKVLSQLFQVFSQGIVGALLGLLSATGLAFIGWLGWQGWHRWQRHVKLQRLPPMEQGYQQMLTWLAARGYPKRPTQTPLEYAVALNQEPQFADGEQVMALVQVYLRWRYGRRAEDAAWFNRQVRSLQRRRSSQTSLFPWHRQSPPRI